MSGFFLALAYVWCANAHHTYGSQSRYLLRKYAAFCNCSAEALPRTPGVLSSIFFAFLVSPLQGDFIDEIPFPGVSLTLHPGL